MRRDGFSVWGVAGLAAAFGLSACAAPLKQTYVAGLPAPPPSPQPPLYAYAWLDRADALLDAIADAPPDYSFDHLGRQFFAWDVDNVLIVEEAGDDGYVLYLFDAGQSLPFLVRTPDFSAGFDRGELAALYMRDGRVYSAIYSSADHAEVHALRERGGGIRDAARRSRWDRDAARAWAGVQSFIVETRDAWDDGWRADQELAEYRRRSEAEADRAALADERRRRREARDEFRRWRDGGFAGAPPPGVSRPDRTNRPDRPSDRDDRVDRPGRPRDRGDRPDRPRDRDDRVDRPERPRDRDERPGRPARPGDAPAPPVNVPPPERPVTPPPRPPVVDRPIEAGDPVIIPETEPDYGRGQPDRPNRPRPPRIEEAPPPSSGRGLIPVSELFRDEEERRRAEAAQEERVSREQEAALQAMREAQAEEARLRRANEEREAGEAVRRSEAAEAERLRAEAAEIARREQESAAANEAARRAEAAEAEARARGDAEAQRQAAAQAAADAARSEREAQAAARAQAEAEARRRAAEQTEAEDARRRAEQEEADARSRAEQRSREMEPRLEPQ